MAALAQGGTHLLSGRIQLFGGRVLLRVSGIVISHAVSREQVDVGVRNVEARNHQSHTVLIKGLVQGTRNLMRHSEQVRRQLSRQVGPTVDLSAGNEQQVTFRQGHDVQEGDAVLVLPDEAAGNLTLNNLGKNRAHNTLLHAPSSARLKLNGQAYASTSMLSPGFRCFKSVPYFAPKFVTRPSIMPVPFWLIMPL